MKKRPIWTAHPRIAYLHTPPGVNASEHYVWNMGLLIHNDNLSHHSLESKLKFPFSLLCIVLRVIHTTTMVKHPWTKNKQIHPPKCLLIFPHDTVHSYAQIDHVTEAHTCAAFWSRCWMTFSNTNRFVIYYSLIMNRQNSPASNENCYLNYLLTYQITPTAWEFKIIMHLL